MTESWQSKLASPTLTAEEFRDLLAERVRERLANVQIEITGPEDFRLAAPHRQSEVLVHTGNAYMDLGDEWEQRLEVLEGHLRSALHSWREANDEGPPVALDEIVPRLKDHLFFEQDEVDQDYLKALRRIHLAADVYVTFAQSTGEGFSFLTTSELVDLNLNDRELVAASVRNMRARMDDVECRGSGPVYMLSCGGNYEACLLLDTEIWTSVAALVDGDIVAAVPARDLLFFTGADSEIGLRELRQSVNRAMDGGLSYFVSDRLLRYRHGEWHEYDASTA